MNAQELITSGMLEAYVLGEGTEEERALIQRMAAQDPTVKAELEEIGIALERYANINAIKPSAWLRTSLLAAIRKAEEPPIPISRQSLSNGPWRWLAAAAVVALLISGAANFMLYRELHQVKDRLAGIENERAVMAEQLQVQKVSMESSQRQLAVVFDPNKHMVPLTGQVIEPKAAARIFMDPSTSDVYIDVLSLPTPPVGKQYQLWAQVDGKMVDAGMLELADNDEPLQQMKPMPNATAFGVTLEKEGGSEVPTLTELYLFGQVG